MTQKAVGASSTLQLQHWFLQRILEAESGIRRLPFCFGIPKQHLTARRPATQNHGKQPEHVKLSVYKDNKQGSPRGRGPLNKDAQKRGPGTDMAPLEGSDETIRRKEDPQMAVELSPPSLETETLEKEHI